MTETEFFFLILNSVGLSLNFILFGLKCLHLKKKFYREKLWMMGKEQLDTERNKYSLLIINWNIMNFFIKKFFLYVMRICAHWGFSFFLLIISDRQAIEVDPCYQEAGFQIQTTSFSMSLRNGLFIKTDPSSFITCILWEALNDLNLELISTISFGWFEI